ncbi:MAG: Unsaturated rhamnogalacturonyl hydrolase YteR [Verrucomicrobiota bacterium]
MIRFSLALALAAATSPSCTHGEAATLYFHRIHKEAAEQQAAATMALMSRVADWQIAHPTKRPAVDWTCGALYSGLTHFALASPDKKYLDHIRAYGETQKWQLGKKKRFFADDQAIGQTWIDLHRLDKRSEQIADTLAVMEDFIVRPDAIGDMTHDYKKKNLYQRWTWCDALFMAPPVLAKLFADTKDPKWEEALLKDYRQTTDYLFDKDENLFYRDHTYFDKKEANGAKVFWSRGNGWVFAGLAHILRELPADAKSRPYFEDLFKKMAKRLAALQQPDGSWHASLLDPASFPVPETSGTGFFTYGFAYGLNAGLLDHKTYAPVVAKGWERLVSCVEADGKLGFVQPIGQDPKLVTRDMTENYGVGAFLLAGTEIRALQLQGLKFAPTRVLARVVPERFDDFSFENDLIAGRFYSSRLKDKVAPVGAIDVWCKNTPALVTAEWFKKGDYHQDHGQGGDFYSCHGSLGAGGLGYLLPEGTLVPSPAYDQARIVSQSFDEVVFELSYPAVQVGSASIVETRRGSLKAGSRCLELSSRFEVKGEASGIRVVAALASRKGAQTAEAAGQLLQWEKADGKDSGFIGLAVKAAPGAKTFADAKHRLLEIGSLKDGARWSSGSCWSKGGIKDFAAWQKIVADEKS